MNRTATGGTCTTTSLRCDWLSHSAIEHATSAVSRVRNGAMLFKESLLDVENRLRYLQINAFGSARNSGEQHIIFEETKGAVAGK